MKLIIVGLRRSGTTIFWETFRQDARLGCYDEPFNPNLSELPEENPKNSRRELIDLYQQDPARFRDMFEPVSLEAELEPNLIDRQAAYLRWLLDTREHVAMDLVRASMKVPALHEVAPEAVVVHLHRHPAAVVSSHMLPSGSKTGLRSKVGDWLRHRTYWRRSHWYNNWGYEQLIDGPTREQFDRRRREIDLDPAAVRSLPAVGKLLAWWRTAWEITERDGKALFGDRFLSIRFEAFCQAPEQTMRRIYQAGGLEYQPLDYSAVRPAKKPYRHDDPRWARFMQQLQMTTLAQDAT